MVENSVAGGFSLNAAQLLGELPVKVISFVSEETVPLFHAWEDISTRVLGEDAEVHCMDSKAFSKISERRANGKGRFRPIYTATAEKTAEAGSDGDGREAFAIGRFAILRQENRSRAFVHSDLNAFWIKDLRPVIEEAPVDLVFSCETGAGSDAVEDWGFGLCSGLFAARGSVAAAAFFDAWWKETLTWRDDQKALNHFLAEKGITWRDSAHPALFKEGEIEVSGCEVRFAVLPEDQVRRAPPIRTNGSTAAVFHPCFEPLHFASYLALYRFIASCDDVFLPEDYLAARPELAAVLEPRHAWDLAMLDYALASASAVEPAWLTHRAWLLHLAGQGAAGVSDIRAALDAAPAPSVPCALTGLMIGNAVGDRALVAQCAGIVASGVDLRHPNFDEAIGELRQARQYTLLLALSPSLLRSALRRRRSPKSGSKSGSSGRATG